MRGIPTTFKCIGGFHKITKVFTSFDKVYTMPGIVWAHNSELNQRNVLQIFVTRFVCLVLSDYSCRYYHSDINSLGHYPSPDINPLLRHHVSILIISLTHQYILIYSYEMFTLAAYTLNIKLL